MQALYISAELTTAVAEYEQDLGIRPGTFCAYEVDVADVADLGSAATLDVLGLAADTLLCSWKEILLVQNKRPPTWDITDRLIALGLAGILVPSARAAYGTNLVLWRWNDRPDRSVRAIDPQGDLPRDQSSWR